MMPLLWKPTNCELQVISTELNNVVVELLQQLLFWQERSKAINIHNAAKKKRLVSGLREVPPLTQKPSARALGRVFLTQARS